MNDHKFLIEFKIEKIPNKFDCCVNKDTQIKICWNFDYFENEKKKFSFENLIFENKIPENICRYEHNM